MTKKVLEVRSRNVESAVEEGLQYLGLTKEDVGVKVLERPAKIVGFSSEAVVWLVYEPVEQSSTASATNGDVNSSSSDVVDNTGIVSTSGSNIEGATTAQTADTQADKNETEKTSVSSEVTGETQSRTMEGNEPEIPQDESPADEVINESETNPEPPAVGERKETPVTTE